MPDFVLDVPQGADVERAIIAFARSGSHTIGTVLFASGTVDRVHLFNFGALTPPFELAGAYRLVSLSGHFYRYTDFDHYMPCFSVVLAGENGNVLGGELAGSIVAVEPVLVVLSVLENPLYLEIHPPPATDEFHYNPAAEYHGDAENGNPPPAANG